MLSLGRRADSFLVMKIIFILLTWHCAQGGCKTQKETQEHIHDDDDVDHDFDFSSNTHGLDKNKSGGEPERPVGLSQIEIGQLFPYHISSS